MDHVHEAEHAPTRTDSGTIWEVCRCGATRRTEHGKQPEQWHVCELCTRA